MKRFGRSEKGGGQGAEALSVALGRHILRTGDTVRACAERFGMSKSYAHQLIGAPLRRADEALYERVQTVMEEHLAVRHLRGGAATREKYRRLRAAVREEKRQAEAQDGPPATGKRGGQKYARNGKQMYHIFLDGDVRVSTAGDGEYDVLTSKDRQTDYFD